MARPALRIEVSAKDQKELRKLVGGGVQQVRVVLRALALLQLAKGVAAPRISGMIPLTPQAIRNVGRRYRHGGLERALYEKQRPGAAEVLDAAQKQRLIAMVCSSPPYGCARWTVRLVAGQLPQTAAEAATEPDAAVIGLADAVYRAAWGRPSGAVVSGDSELLTLTRAG